MSGGYYGLKGYIVQTVAAMLESLGNTEWTDIKLEPGTTKDKADFILYHNEKAIQSVQVKSSIGKFGKNSIEEWLEGVCSDVPEGMHELILIGDQYTADAEKFIRETNETDNKAIKTLRVDMESLLQMTNGAVLEYVRREFPDASFKAEAVFAIYDRIFSALMINGVRSVKYSRQEFHDVVNRMLELYLVQGNGVFSEDLTVKEQIWNAMKKRFVSMKSEGGRFSFDVIPDILPNGKQVEYQFTTNARLADNMVTPLKDLISQNTDNIAVIGTGGIGKTTYLQNVLEESYLQQGDYALNEPVPIFIELFHCLVDLGSRRDRDSGRTNFISRSIAAICENHYSFDCVSEGTVLAIEKEFQKVPEDGKREYILLLDGFNEVSIRRGSETRIQLGREIEIMSSWPNVRIIATSRETEYAYFAAGFRNLYVAGLKDGEIREYLRKTEMFSTAEVNVIMADKRLLECIHIPLYLLMYASSGEKEGFDPQTLGEILYTFFHRNSGFYNLRSRAKATNTYGLEREELHAILNYILPYIGWTMDESDTFYLNSQEIKDCYDKALHELKLLLSDIGTDRIYLFNREINVGQQLQMLNSLQKDSMFEKAIDCIQNFFGLIYHSQAEQSREYSFVHHQFRDYFSAIWNRVLLQAMPLMKNDMALVDTYLGDSVWQIQKVHMLSEILMEHRNCCSFDEDHKVWKSPEKCYAEQSIAENALNCLRGVERDHKHLISNLLRVVLEGRHELAGLDLGELNLEDFSLYGIPCSKGLHKTIRLSAGFYGAHINEQTLEPTDHKDRVIDIIYRDEKCYTFDSNGIIKCWDIRSGVLLNEWQSEIPDLFGFAPSGYLKVSPDGIFLAALVQLPELNCVNLIDVRAEDGQGKLIKTDRNQKLEAIAFSEDSRSLLMLDQTGKLYSYNCVEQKMEREIEVTGLLEVTRICQETSDSKIWLFTSDYSLEDQNTDTIWEDESEDEADQETDYEASDPETDEEVQEGILCKILTLDPDTGVTEIKREFTGNPGTNPAACCLSERGSVLYFDGARGSLMIGVGSEKGWEVFKEITAEHKDVTMTLFRHPNDRELFYIIYPDEIYLVSINRRYHCSIISRYQADSVNELAKSKGQEDNLDFCSIAAPSGRYFVLLNEDGVNYEWDEKENVVRRKYNSFFNECVGLQEDKIGKQYILIHRNNSICFFDSLTDRLTGSVDLYAPDYEIRLFHFMEKERALIVAMVRLDNEKVVSLNVDTGYSTLLFSTAYENETIETIDSDIQTGNLLITTQYRCCEIEYQSLTEREVAVSVDNRRFINGQYGSGVIKIVEVTDTADPDFEDPICNIYSRDGSRYQLKEKRVVKELRPEMYPYFICQSDDLGMEGTRDSRGMQLFWLTEGFFLQLPEELADSEREMPLKPHEEGFVWHRHELRHYGEYRNRDIHMMSRNESGILFVRNCRTLYFTEDIHHLTYEELDDRLNEERGLIGGNSYWSFVIRLENGDLICNYEGYGLMRLDSSSGEMIREISYTPGLVLWGCNFVDIEASDEVKTTLRENGAIVNDCTRQ